METGVACSKKECPGQGTWFPVFVLRSERDGSELEASLPDVAVCEMHRQSSKLDEFLSPEGWDKIAKFLREAGKGTFRKRSTRLDWGHSRNPDLLPF